MAVTNSTDPSWNGVVAPPGTSQITPAQGVTPPGVSSPTLGGTRTMAPQELFRRRWRVTVDTIEFSQLDISAKIEKSTDDKPNTCELSIWNLSEQHRQQIAELNPPSAQVSVTAKAKEKAAARKKATKGIPVMIEAGYGDGLDDDLSLLWLGDLRYAHSERQGPDWVTKLEAGDGEKAYQNARMNVSYGPKTPVDVALRAMVRALGLGEGNVEATVNRLKLAGGGTMFPQGVVLAGSVSRLLNNFARSADLEWSIQNGAVQFIDRGKALDQEAILVSSDTGMIDVPTVDVDGVLTVKMLLVKDIRPGRKLVVDARGVKGNYKAEKISYTLDSAGNDWGVSIQATRY
jgi:hypothetical protein